MNKTVALVQEWGLFEDKFPEAGLDDFCRYYLAKKAQAHGPEKEVKPMTDEKLIPPAAGELMRLLRRIGKFHIAYSNIALEGTGINQIEEFGMMVSIHNMGNPRKSDVVYSSILELSSGTNMLNRLKGEGLVKEYNDEEDKRAKRLQLTPKGETTMRKCGVKILKLATMILADVSDDDKHLCISILKNTDAKFSALYPKQKNKTFDEIYDSNMEEEKG